MRYRTLCHVSYHAHTLHMMSHVCCMTLHVVVRHTKPVPRDVLRCIDIYYIFVCIYISIYMYTYMYIYIHIFWMHKPVPRDVLRCITTQKRHINMQKRCIHTHDVMTSAHFPTRALPHTPFLGTKILFPTDSQEFTEKIIAIPAKRLGFPQILLVPGKDGAQQRHVDEERHALLCVVPHSHVMCHMRCVSCDV